MTAKLMEKTERNRPSLGGGLMKNSSVIRGRSSRPGGVEHFAPAEDTIEPLVFKNELTVWSDVVIDLHVSQCRKWAFNPRHAIVEDRIPELAKLIRDLGQLDPIIVAEARDGSGMYDVLCGQRRWLAIRSIDYNGGIIKAKVVPKDMPFDTMIQLAVESQANTDPLRDIDYALTILELDRQNKNPMITLGKDKGTISKLRKVGHLPNQILACVMENPDKFSMNICYELAQVCPLKTEPEMEGGSLRGKNVKSEPEWTEKQLDQIQVVVELALDIVAKDLTIAEVIQAVRKMSGSVSKQTRRSWAIYDIDPAVKSLGSVKARESTGEVTLILRGVTPHGLEKLRAFTLELAKDKDSVDPAKALASKAKSADKAVATAD